MNLLGIRKLADRFGASVEQRSQGYGTRVEVLAPDGYVWAEGMGARALVCDIEPGDDRGARLTDLAERMGFGLEREVDYNPFDIFEGPIVRTEETRHRE